MVQFQNHSPYPGEPDLSIPDELLGAGVRTGSSIVNTSAVINGLPLGVMICGLDLDGTLRILFVNHMASRVLEIDDSTVLPCPLDKVSVLQDANTFSNHVFEVFRLGRESRFEWGYQTGAMEHYLTSQLYPLWDHEDRVYQVVCTIEDRTAEKLAERNLLHHAFHDSLTGLPNRVLFRNKLEEAVTDYQRTGGEVGCAVLIVNIDRFQQINESFGHSAGDRFLVSLASALKRCIRAHDTLARLSGDEFAILVGRCTDFDDVAEISDRIHKITRQPFDLDGNEVFTSVSVGLATTRSSSAHPEDLIRDADFAMHTAKSAGKSRTESYRRESHQRARSQFHLETELRRAVERDELALHYQPLVDIRSNTLVGFEALARWNHRERGFVSPGEFIPLAEETGIIVDLGRWALNAACAQVRHWIDLKGEDRALPVNVNVSGIQFGRDDVVGMVQSCLEKHRLDGRFIRVELTETAIMANPESISECLTRLRALGVKVALDDFGTGYSSLNYLHHFPIDIIKIDRNFINQLQYDNAPYRILDMIGKLARNLGNDLVAEGIEDMHHIEMLHSLDFHNVQGFFYSRPVPGEQATAMLDGDVPWDKGNRSGG
ncbi:EAL domain-containing protein [Yunchengibacter salinarum]|uniref:EAL domain-containing protein n=1 Tax=Yunchengibacter salinarum TaxID=3133399 RepID=UPI0035B5EB3E